MKIFQTHWIHIPIAIIFNTHTQCLRFFFHLRNPWIWLTNILIWSFIFIHFFIHRQRGHLYQLHPVPNLIWNGVQNRRGFNSAHVIAYKMAWAPIEENLACPSSSECRNYVEHETLECHIYAQNLLVWYSISLYLPYCIMLGWLCCWTSIYNEKATENGVHIGNTLNKK